MSERASLQSLESLYRRRFNEFVRTASAIANSHEGGHDAVHDAFVSAVRNRQSYRGEGTLEAWVWPMVVHNAQRYRRRRDLVGGDELPHAIWTDRHRDDHTALRNAVAALPERQRLMVFLRYYGDLDYQAIAEVAGIRIGTVGAELHAAHQSLRHSLEEVLTRE